MNILSKPRPNGSKALQDTRDALVSWLSDHEIPYMYHSYQVRPYFMEAVGLSLASATSPAGIGCMVQVRLAFAHHCYC